jgi:hypothetical protein
MENWEVMLYQLANAFGVIFGPKSPVTWFLALCGGYEVYKWASWKFGFKPKKDYISEMSSKEVEKSLRECVAGWNKHRKSTDKLLATRGNRIIKLEYKLAECKSKNKR